MYCKNLSSNCSRSISRGLAINHGSFNSKGKSPVPMTSLDSVWSLPRNGRCLVRLTETSLASFPQMDVVTSTRALAWLLQLTMRAVMSVHVIGDYILDKSGE
jgi:hypothetical protein